LRQLGLSIKLYNRVLAGYNYILAYLKIGIRRVMTTLTVQDLWDDSVAVAELLQQWDDVRGAAGGGLGSGLVHP